MSPVHFPEANRTFTAAGTAALPAHNDQRRGIVTTCWQLTWRDRWRLLWSGRLWAQTTTPMLGLDVHRPSLPQPVHPS